MTQVVDVGPAAAQYQPQALFSVLAGAARGSASLNSSAAPSGGSAGYGTIGSQAVRIIRARPGLATAEFKPIVWI